MSVRRLSIGDHQIIKSNLILFSVFTLKPLEHAHILAVLHKAIRILSENLTVTMNDRFSPVLTKSPDQPLHPNLPNVTEKALASIASFSMGDARIAISLLEYAALSPPQRDEESFLASLKQTVVMSYDREGEAHYDSISALHKSVRNSNGDAAMFSLARMLINDEDPVFIARRLVVMASEDIGLANENALPLVSSIQIVS
jgi:putative ATPase